MKKLKNLLLIVVVISLALFLSGCADITLEKWIKVDKTQDEIRAKISTDYRQYYAMIKQEWEEKGLDYNATEEDGLYLIELSRTEANLVEESNSEVDNDIDQYTKVSNEDGSTTYTFGEISANSEQNETDSSGESEWGKELGEAMMAGYKFKWIVHFPDKVMEVKIKGSGYKVTEEAYSGRTINLEIPLKEIPSQIIVTTK